MTTALLVRDAKVEVTKYHTADGKVCASITVDDKFQHVFSESSRVSQSLRLSETSHLQEYLMGGSYFFVNDTLVDFRDKEYKGFIHEDSSIDQLMNVIGFDEISDQQRRLLRLNTQGEVGLVKKWSDVEFTIPHYAQGGDFSSRLLYSWNPFHQHVKGIFQLTRLICTNGMIGMTDFLNTKVPLINRWEEHLHIANTQIQRKVEEKVIGRIGEMGNIRANVASMLRIAEHATKRLEDTFDLSQRGRLQRIAEIANPVKYLSEVYNESVFEDKNVAAHMPSHMSQFDAWNLTTEIMSHTEGTAKSSTGGLQRLANELMFPTEKADRLVSTNQGQFGIAMDDNRSNVPLSPFSSPERAFFGYQQI